MCSASFSNKHRERSALKRQATDSKLRFHKRPLGIRRCSRNSPRNVNFRDFAIREVQNALLIDRREEDTLIRARANLGYGCGSNRSRCGPLLDCFLSPERSDRIESLLNNCVRPTRSHRRSLDAETVIPYRPEANENSYTMKMKRARFKTCPKFQGGEVSRRSGDITAAREY